MIKYLLRITVLLTRFDISMDNFMLCAMIHGTPELVGNAAYVLGTQSPRVLESCRYPRHHLSPLAKFGHHCKRKGALLNDSCEQDANNRIIKASTYYISSRGTRRRPQVLDCNIPRPACAIFPPLPARPPSSAGYIAYYL